MTPNRPEATCLMAERRRSPFWSGIDRAGSSPPSPVLERPPRRFIAIASVSCASGEIDPRLIAPVTNRRTIAEDGSTSASVERRAGRDRLEQAAQRREPGGASVDGAGVVAERRVALVADGPLQAHDRLRLPHVVLTAAAIAVLAADLELLARAGAERAGVPGGGRGVQLGEADPAEPRDGAREVAIDQGGAEADGLEDLGAPVALHGRDPHLGAHLEQAGADPVQVARPVGGRQGLEHQIGGDGGRAVPEQEREVHRLAGLAGLDDQAAHRARALADEVRVHRRHREQRRHGAWPASTPRSESTTIDAPSHTARDAARQAASIARSIPAGPSATG